MSHKAKGSFQMGEEEEEDQTPSVRSVVLKKTVLAPKEEETFEPKQKEEQEKTSGLSEFYNTAKQKVKEMVPKVKKGLEEAGEAVEASWNQGHASGWKQQEAINELANRRQRELNIPYHEARKQVMDSKWWEHMNKREDAISNLMKTKNIDRNEAEKLWKKQNDYQ